jgi:thiol-disulfide isomerase/thioredoxin
MNTRIWIAFAFLASLLLAAPAMAQRGQKLKVGDPAPGLSISEWVKGEETSIKPGTTYIVEFWATWCPPCRKSIPHLTELKSQYTDEELRIIGVTTEESDLVNAFVKKQGRRMGYTVVIDKKSGTDRAWMKAAGQSGIPTAFVVGPEGKVQYIGNPLSSEFDEVVEQVMSGRYNKKLMDTARSHMAAIERSREMKNWVQYDTLTKEVIDRDPRIFYRLILDRIDVYMLEQHDPVKAYAYVREVIETYPDDPELLSWVGERIATNPQIPDSMRDMDIALEAVQAARTNGRPNDTRFIASEAEVRFHRGEIDRAVELQEQAYFLSIPRRKETFRPKLEAYRSKQTELAKLDED